MKKTPDKPKLNSVKKYPTNIPQHYQGHQKQGKSKKLLQLNI